MSQIRKISDYLFLQQLQVVNTLGFALKQAQTLPNADAIANITIKMEKGIQIMLEAMQLIAPLQNSDAWEDISIVEEIINQLEANIEMYKKNGISAQCTASDELLETQMRLSEQNIEAGCQIDRQSPPSKTSEFSKDVDCRHSNHNEEIRDVKSKRKSPFIKFIKSFVPTSLRQKN